MDPTEFPANSKKSKEPKPEKPKTEKIIQGEAIKRRTPLGKKFKEVFFTGDAKRAALGVTSDIVIPRLRDIIFNGGSGLLERIVYGESRRQAQRSVGNMTPRIQYNTPVRRDPREVGTLNTGYSSTTPARGTSGKQRHDIGEVILGSREEAQLVVEQMIAIADQYDVATVGDLYGFLGFPTNYVDEQWGWESFASVEIKQVNQGYLIDLPDPEPLAR